MFDQMHVRDTKTTRTKTIYDKTGASLDWIRLNSVFILRVISFRFYWRSVFSKHWFSEGEPYVSQRVMYGWERSDTRYSSPVGKLTEKILVVTNFMSHFNIFWLVPTYCVTYNQIGFKIMISLQREDERERIFCEFSTMMFISRSN